MLPARLLRRAITILTPTVTVDRYGTQTKSWTNPTRVAVRGELQPRKAGETEVGRSLEAIDAVLYLLPGTAISSGDRVEVSGRVYNVVGPPMQVHRLGRPHHLIVNVTASEG